MTREEIIDGLEIYTAGRLNKARVHITVKELQKFINEIKALEQEACEDWHDIPSDEMTLEQARQAVKDLRKKLAEYLMQEPCEDAISRDELLKAIYTWDKFGCDANTKLVQYQDHYIPYIHYDDVIKCIKGMPSVTPQPKIGQWIFKNDNITIPTGYYQCSECEKGKLLFKSNYCPNCGRKMIQEVEE